MTNSISTGVAFSDPALSGATIDNSTIGGTTRGPGNFTNLDANGNVRLGDAATDYLAFYNASLTNQPTSANEAAVATAAAITAAGAYGFANAAQANGIITLLNQIRTDLVTLGLIKGS